CADVMIGNIIDTDFVGAIRVDVRAPSAVEGVCTVAAGEHIVIATAQDGIVASAAAQIVSDVFIADKQGCGTPSLGDGRRYEGENFFPAPGRTVRELNVLNRTATGVEIDDVSTASIR